MRKIFFSLFTALVCSAGVAHAQLEKGNVIIGGHLANMGFGLGEKSSFSLGISPQVGYFVEDNIVLGGKVGLGYQTLESEGNIFDYGINAFGRYYLEPGEKGVKTLLNHGRFFGEMGVGIAGTNGASLGFNFNIGPGYAYFITPNVALEGLLKYNGTFGAGSSNGLGFNLGFQIHLPSGKLKQMKENPSSL